LCSVITPSLRFHKTSGASTFQTNKCPEFQMAIGQIKAGTGRWNPAETHRDLKWTLYWRFSVGLSSPEFSGSIWSQISRPSDELETLFCCDIYWGSGYFLRGYRRAKSQCYSSFSHCFTKQNRDSSLVRYKDHLYPVCARTALDVVLLSVCRSQGSLR
jgi:hypothetical protein